MRPTWSSRARWAAATSRSSPGTSSFLGALDDWPLRVIQATGQITFAVHGGFVEVSNDRVTVLSDVAEHSNGIDVARATPRSGSAEAAMRADPEDAEAAAAVQRASDPPRSRSAS